MAKILIVEDELAIADLIALHMKIAGHTSHLISNGDEVLPYLKEHTPDIIILDVMLPGRDGFSLISEIKNIPVIFLTAKDRLEDKVAGLKLGADDYIVKPFEAIELMARIEAVLRRCDKTEEVFKLGNVEVNIGEHKVLMNGVEVELASREFDLLKMLIENKNLALTRDKLLEVVWGMDYFGETRTVDVHIQKLRKKLGFDDYIKTVYKYGYRLEVPQ
ncbi:DNA-binding response regulator [Clostridia bacterium]|nr:DNA-binding response regulator [Clostridia bacterium]